MRSNPFSIMSGFSGLGFASFALRAAGLWSAVMCLRDGVSAALSLVSTTGNHDGLNF